MNLSQFLENAVANWVRGTAFPAAPGSLEVAISTTDPLDDGSAITEPTGGYARQTITFGAPTTTLAGVTITNDTQITFGVSTAAWGTITHAAVYDAGSGDLLFVGPLSACKAVANGDTFTLDVGDLQHVFKAFFSHYLGTQVAEWIRGTAMPAAPTQVDLALSTQDILADGTGLIEPPGTDNYARQIVAWSGVTQTLGVGAAFSNTNAMIFGPVTTNDWPTVTHAGLYSGTDLLIFGPLAASRSAEIGDSVPIAIGAISILVR